MVLKRTAQGTTDESGISLVEALIAVGLLFIIAAGILPLFARALVNNAMGNDATRMTNFARETAEDASGSPFSQPNLEITANNSRVITEWWFTNQLSGGSDLPTWEGAWFPYDATTPTPPTPAREYSAQWYRTTTVRQYGVGQWVAGAVLDPASAYSAGTAQDYVQLKLVEIDVRSPSALDDSPGNALLGFQAPTRVFYLKSF